MIELECDDQDQPQGRLRQLWGRLAKRSLIGSDAVIVATIAIEVFQAGVFLSTTSANGAIPMASFLSVFRHPETAAAVMLIFSALAVAGQWAPRLLPMVRLWLLVPEQALLFIPALGAVYAVVTGSYADLVPRPSLFILCDQLWRLCVPGLYSVAIFARIKAG
jgi:hypothetical protein